MSLLDHVRAQPKFEGVKSKRIWGDYKESFLELKAKGYPTIRACEVIAEYEALTKDETRRFYNAARKWS